MAIYVYTNQRDGGIAHIPSSSEFSDMRSIMTSLSINTATWYKTKLHMPFAWERQTDGSIYYQWEYAKYWTATASSSQATKSNRFSMYWDNNSVEVAFRADASPIRLFFDEYIEPDNTRTIETWTLWGAGVFYNATLWVISLTNGSDKSISIQDKNVWATEVYTSWTLTGAKMWKMFQRWNYYWFPSTWTVSKTSTTQVNTTWYGWDNPYSRDVFVKSYPDRSSVQNGNLRTNSKEEYFVIE